LPKPTVTRCRSTSRRIPSGLGSSGTTTVPPMNSTGRTLTPMPPVRKNGAIAIVTSSRRKSALVTKFTAFQVTLPCVRTTALGCPVVPDVCGRRNGTSGPTASSIGRSGEPATRVSKSIAPTRAPSTATRCRTEAVVTGSAPPYWTRTTGSVWARMTSCSAGRRRWFTGASIAPSRPSANRHSRNAVWFGPTHATRSPRPTPSRRRPFARRPMRSSSSA
jgi:hypothetical protein